MGRASIGALLAIDRRYLGRARRGARGVLRPFAELHDGLDDDILMVLDVPARPFFPLGRLRAALWHRLGNLLLTGRRKDAVIVVAGPHVDSRQCRGGSRWEGPVSQLALRQRFGLDELGGLEYRGTWLLLSAHRRGLGHPIQGSAGGLPRLMRWSGRRGETFRQKEELCVRMISSLMLRQTTGFTVVIGHS